MSRKPLAGRAGRPASTRSAGPRLTHVGVDGQPRMVDISAKAATRRRAIARARVVMSPQALEIVRDGRLAKGDPFQPARLAGIMAAKRTSELIPLCHPVPLTNVDVELVPRTDGYELRAVASTTAPTGVEMEALTAVSLAALTLYDMVKAVDKGMVITDVCLVEKTGGRSGRYRRPAD